ncbi:unnamed protein product [Somion occarium]|uniref:NmrA-like domain-containing protein n=1 Tax=Somion occarium TaxID=3059160 RepID=A0ABP1EDN8_9APHY
MSESHTSIFLTGATGYIGGSVLARLLAHPSAETFNITVVSRQAEKAKKLESFGVNAVVGSMDDYALVEELASKAHVVIDCADADNLPAVEAILRGLRKRHATVGDLSTLIHTSGTGVLTDTAKGLYASDVICDDLNADQIEAIPDTALHRDVDLAVVNADKQGYLKSYIIIPSTIYGIAKNPLVEAGRKQAAVVGKGVSFWPDVSIDDVSELYIVLFDSIVSNPDKTGHGREGYYFGENGEHRWYDISRAVGEALVELGISKDPEPTSFTDEELIKYFGSVDAGNYAGSNSRCRANRGRSIGWNPKHTTKDMLASIKPEVEAILKQQGGK